MQVKKEQLERQQQILTALGYYHHKVDGIWGPRSIEAKKRFEALPAFCPGIPRNGMPFGDKGPYPPHITMDYATGLLDHPKRLEVASKPPQSDPEPEADPDHDPDMALPVAGPTLTAQQQHSNSKKK